MAKVMLPKQGKFKPVTLVIETKEELEELVEDLGNGTGELLQEEYNELDDYLNQLN